MDPAAASPVPVPDERLVAAPEIQRALGQSVSAALNLSHWDEGAGLEKFLTQVPGYITRTVRAENRLSEAIRQEVLTKLATFADAPANAGVYAVNAQHLRDALRHHLLPGGVTACQGACAGHDALTATIVSIGVSLVCYDGRQRSWKTTFLRHDYGLSGGDVLAEIKQLLDRRGRRDPAGSRDQLSYLLRRGFLAAAERKALLQKADTTWRLGRGLPAPLELLTGSGSMDLLDDILPVLDQLLLRQQRWVFLPAAQGNRALLTLANALEPGQLAILQKGKSALDIMLEAGHFDVGYRKKVIDFANTLGEVMVIGGFRATPHAPAQLFVAHTAQALTAGVIAMADASLQPHRGAPLLLDLAGLSAKVGLGMDAFQGVVETAYAQAGAHGFYASTEPSLAGIAS